MKEINWREVVNKMTGPFPETGIDTPAFEVIKKKPELSPDDVGEFSKLSMVIYFFTDPRTGKTYTAQRHWLMEFGEVELRDALKAIEKKA